MKNKNIWLLPTNKPSRLHLRNGKLILHRLQYTQISQNIYITSDEEIKFNDYITDGYKVWKWKDDSSLLGRHKIILTTDSDLIKDGVQRIDDEFLEWFVKNPSCEWVEVEKYNGFKTKKAGESWLFENDKYNWKGDSLDYKIIIPKEEPKQETLEEASIRAAKSGLFKDETLFIAGAKWQQEQNKGLYSEEECFKTLHNLITDIELKGIVINDDTDLRKWFEQFKKK